MNLFNRRKIYLYSVIQKRSKDEEVDKRHFLTLTSSFKDAEEYINKLLYLRNKSHFKSWCELKGKDSDPTSLDFQNSWIEYYNNVLLEQDSQFAIIKLQYKIDDIASLLRIAGHFDPIGCSFDKEVEWQHYYMSIKDQLYEELEDDPSIKDNLNSIMKEIKEKYPDAFKEEDEYKA